MSGATQGGPEKMWLEAGSVLLPIRAWVGTGVGWWDGDGGEEEREGQTKTLRQTL